MTTTNNSYKAYLFLLGCILVYFFPFFIYGKNTLFPITDNLDCYYVWNKLVGLPKYAWAAPSTIVSEFMNGVPRFTLSNSYSLFFILNVFFSSFYATSIYIVIIHTVACFCMYAFAKKQLTPESTTAAVIAAIIFGLQPFTYAFGLSIPLLPLLVMAFINFYKKEERNKDWLIIVLYPFLSNFQSVGIFLIAFWLLLVCYFFITKKNNVGKLLLAAIIMIGLYYLNNFPTLNNLLFNCYFTSHRKDFKNQLINSSLYEITNTHTLVYYLKFILTQKLLLLSVFILYKMYKNKHQHFKLLLLIVSIVTLFKFQDLFLESSLLKYLQERFTIIKMFHFYKFFVFESFLTPTGWALALGYLLYLYNNKWCKYVLYAIFIPLTISHALIWAPILNKPWQKVARPFDGYYSPDLFTKIKATISLPTDQYKVACFGIHPATAQYNGMYTVDGYLNNYPLEYKNKFREVIKNDLDTIHKKIGYRDWDFETTGHRCYLQTIDLVEKSDLVIPIDKLNPLSGPQTMHWNIDALKSMGCNYIISSVEINNTTNSFLLINQFENRYYKLYLYKIL